MILQPANGLASPSLPSEVVYGTAISLGDKIFLIGGGMQTDQTEYEFDT